MRAIHQLVAGFSNGDAISNEARVLRSIFRGWGFASEIYCESRRILPELRKDALDAESRKSDFKPDDIVLLHLSIGSPLNDFFSALPCRKAILYHNITPAEYFQAVQPQTAFALARGREQAHSLAQAATVVMADSRYNAGELVAWGYSQPVHVLPLVLDLSQLSGPADRSLLRQFDDGLTNVLFVGRGAPNKRIEDVLTAFYYFQRHVKPESRLIHVGSFAGTESYQAVVYSYRRQLRLPHVEFLGNVPQHMLNAAYRSAHLFLSMSEHEGFCIPILESMACGIPVLAYAAAAVPETMDGAGVLFREKQFEAVAEMMGLLTLQPAFRNPVLAGQQTRMTRYAQLNLEAELREYLRPLL